MFTTSWMQMIGLHFECHENFNDEVSCQKCNSLEHGGRKEKCQRGIQGQLYTLKMFWKCDRCCCKGRGSGWGPSLGAAPEGVAVGGGDSYTYPLVKERDRSNGLHQVPLPSWCCLLTHKFQSGFSVLLIS